MTLTRRVLSLIFPWIYRAYGFFWRYRFHHKPSVLDQPDIPKILAHWHGDELVAVHAFRDQHLSIMASRSDDGQWLTSVLKRLGYETVRGSSSRGGVGGLKGLIDKVRSGKSAAIAVDGPRGPRHEVKPGIIKLAQITGAPIILGAISSSKAHIFERAWNRCFLPWPFSLNHLVFGVPLFIPRDADEIQLEEYRVLVQTELLRLKAEAESYTPVIGRIAPNPQNAGNAVS